MMSLFSDKFSSKIYFKRTEIAFYRFSLIRIYKSYKIKSVKNFISTLSYLRKQVIEKNGKKKKKFCKSWFVRNFLYENRNSGERNFQLDSHRVIVFLRSNHIIQDVMNIQMVNQNLDSYNVSIVLKRRIMRIKNNKQLYIFSIH